MRQFAHGFAHGVGGAALALMLISASPELARAAEREPEDGFGQRAAHAIAAYIPNRLMDFVDLARFRLRFGPGNAASFRATRAASSVVGGYEAVFIGLHGPRGKPRFPTPFGLESMNWDHHTDAFGVSDPPYYGRWELGAGAQLGFFGLDLGVAPFEAWDLLAGVFFFDPADDDH